MMTFIVLCAMCCLGLSFGQDFSPNVWAVDSEPTRNVNVSGMTFFHAMSDRASPWEPAAKSSTDNNSNNKLSLNTLPKDTSSNWGSPFPSPAQKPNGNIQFQNGGLDFRMTSQPSTEIPFKVKDTLSSSAMFAVPGDSSPMATIRNNAGNQGDGTGRTSNTGIDALYKFGTVGGVPTDTFEPVGGVPADTFRTVGGVPTDTFGTLSLKPTDNFGTVGGTQRDNFGTVGGVPADNFGVVSGASTTSQVNSWQYNFGAAATTTTTGAPVDLNTLGIQNDVIGSTGTNKHGLADTPHNMFSSGFKNNNNNNMFMTSGFNNNNNANTQTYLTDSTTDTSATNTMATMATDWTSGSAGNSDNMGVNTQMPPSVDRKLTMSISEKFVDHSKKPMFRVKTEFVDTSDNRTPMFETKSVFIDTSKAERTRTTTAGLDDATVDRVTPYVSPVGTPSGNNIPANGAIPRGSINFADLAANTPRNIGQYTTTTANPVTMSTDKINYTPPQPSVIPMVTETKTTTPTTPRSTNLQIENLYPEAPFPINNNININKAGSNPANININNENDSDKTVGTSSTLADTLNINTVTNNANVSPGTKTDNFLADTSKDEPTFHPSPIPNTNTISNVHVPFNTHHVVSTHNRDQFRTDPNVQVMNPNALPGNSNNVNDGPNINGGNIGNPGGLPDNPNGVPTNSNGFNSNVGTNRPVNSINRNTFSVNVDNQNGIARNINGFPVNSANNNRFMNMGQGQRQNVGQQFQGQGRGQNFGQQSPIGGGIQTLNTRNMNQFNGIGTGFQQNTNQRNNIPGTNNGNFGNINTNTNSFGNINTNNGNFVAQNPGNQVGFFDNTPGNNMAVNQNTLTNRNNGARPNGAGPNDQLTNRNNGVPSSGVGLNDQFTNNVMNPPINTNRNIMANNGNIIQNMNTINSNLVNTASSNAGQIAPVNRVAQVNGILGGNRNSNLGNIVSNNMGQLPQVTRTAQTFGAGQVNGVNIPGGNIQSANRVPTNNPVITNNVNTVPGTTNINQNNPNNVQPSINRNATPFNNNLPGGITQQPPFQQGSGNTFRQPVRNGFGGTSNGNTVNNPMATNLGNSGTAAPGGMGLNPPIQTLNNVNTNTGVAGKGVLNNGMNINTDGRDTVQGINTNGRGTSRFPSNNGVAGGSMVGSPSPPNGGFGQPNVAGVQNSVPPQNNNNNNNAVQQPNTGIASSNLQSSDFARPFNVNPNVPLRNQNNIANQVQLGFNANRQGTPVPRQNNMPPTNINNNNNIRAFSDINTNFNNFRNPSFGIQQQNNLAQQQQQQQGFVNRQNPFPSVGNNNFQIPLNVRRFQNNPGQFVNRNFQSLQNDFQNIPLGGNLNQFNSRQAPAGGILQGSSQQFMQQNFMNGFPRNGQFSPLG